MPSDQGRLTDTELTMISRLENLAEHGASPPECRDIVEIAQTTQSPSVRGAAAIALADLHVSGADAILIELIGSAATKHYRGTLLYALDEWGGALPVGLAAALLLEENYEGREETLMLINKQSLIGTVEDFDTAIAALKPMTASNDTYVASVAKRATRWLRPLRRRVAQERRSA